jgi:hypothetical protein
MRNSAPAPGSPPRAGFGEHGASPLATSPEWCAVRLPAPSAALRLLAAKGQAAPFWQCGNLCGTGAGISISENLAPRRAGKNRRVISRRCILSKLGNAYTGQPKSLLRDWCRIEVGARHSPPRNRSSMRRSAYPPGTPLDFLTPPTPPEPASDETRGLFAAFKSFI